MEREDKNTVSISRLEVGESRRKAHTLHNSRIDVKDERCEMKTET